MQLLLQPYATVSANHHTTVPPIKRLIKPDKRISQYVELVCNVYLLHSDLKELSTILVLDWTCMFDGSSNIRGHVFFFSHIHTRTLQLFHKHQYFIGYECRYWKQYAASNVAHIDMFSVSLWKAQTKTLSCVSIAHPHSAGYKNNFIYFFYFFHCRLPFFIYSFFSPHTSAHMSKTRQKNDSGM